MILSTSKINGLALVILIPLLPHDAVAQGQQRILDVHLHANRESPGVAICPLTGILGTEDVDGQALCDHPLGSAASREGLMAATLSAMERHNIVGVISGSDLDLLRQWREAAPDRVIPAVRFSPSKVSADSLRHLVEAGSVKVLGEVLSQYEGLPPNDVALEPYFSLAEQLEVPVGIHVAGLGAATPGLRIALGSPLLLEEVLVRHPDLRLYVMHAGFPFLDEMVSILRRYPEVYVDIGWISWQMPRTIFHSYLRQLVDHGFGKRIMFGTDQVWWPGAIDYAVAGIEEADFLSSDQKRDIFFNNAARFLRLDTSPVP